MLARCANSLNRNSMRRDIDPKSSLIRFNCPRELCAEGLREVTNFASTVAHLHDGVNLQQRLWNCFQGPHCPITNVSHRCECNPDGRVCCADAFEAEAAPVSASSIMNSAINPTGPSADWSGSTQVHQQDTRAASRRRSRSLKQIRF